MVPTEEDLAFWIKNKYNVLFIGSHGIGKTSLVVNAFKKHNLTYKYFSAATMDPWVDFIGVPKEQEDDNGSYLDLIKPKDLRDDTIHAMFFDEYNRAPAKVQNAVMELIQFKSINGKKFENLNVIWAAINESDTDGIDYNVEKLDYAQLDRFHVIVRLPSNPQSVYFKGKHGLYGEIICDWWDGLSEELKTFISPRRLEYVLDVYTNGGDIHNCLPANCNTKTLVKNLKNGLPYDNFCNLLNKGDTNELTKWLQSAENLSQVESKIVSHHLEDCLQLLSMEKQTELLTRNASVQLYIEKNSNKFSDLIATLKMSKNTKIKQWAKTIKTSDTLVSKKIAGLSWEPKIVNSKLEYMTGLFKGYSWNKDLLNKISGTVMYYSENNSRLSNTLIDITPHEKYYMTNEKIKNLSRIMVSLNTYKMKKSQLETTLDALNHWSYGLQSSTMNHSLLIGTFEIIFKDMLSTYILNETKATPHYVFSRWHYIYKIYKQLGLQWISISS